MARILIVDDEAGYREQLEMSLIGLGHEPRTAGTGREAIDLGTRFHPDILVADWMLADDLHGLHVVCALRAADPHLQAILITGFPSRVLREEAGSRGVVDFLEKPFDIARLQQAIQRATLASDDEPRLHPLALIEIDADRRIVSASDRARDLFATTRAGRDAAHLGAVLREGEHVDLNRAVDRWIVVTPDSEDGIEWHLRAQEEPDEGTRLVIIRRREEPQHISRALVDMLLGYTPQTANNWPFDGRVLIIDDEELTRTCFVSMLERTGAGCYGVESARDATRLIQTDRGIAFVVLDYNLVGSDPAENVRALREVRDDLTLVGNSGEDHRADFAALGVELYLDKPWRADDLINLLPGRIGYCIECGLPLPLRRPRGDETGESWICRNCGARYHALIDDDLPIQTHANVERAGPG